MMERYKLYISPCPNDTFAFDALINGRIDCKGLDFDVQYLDIEELNYSALRGEPDFVKVSAAAIPYIYRDYELCQSGAALGWGNGPLVVRRSDFDATKPMLSVATPGEMTTANLLFKRYFPDVKTFHPMFFSDIAERVERGEVDGGILIHEGRFTYSQRNLELVADLGKMWEEQMKMPLPLGVIMARRSLGSEVRKEFETLLAQSVRCAIQSDNLPLDFIREHAQEMDEQTIKSHIELFVSDFTIELGEVGKKAVEELVNIKLTI